jgi:hypothetical protein
LSALAGVLLGLACGGCSLVFVTPAPEHAHQPVAHPHVDCTTSVAAPVIDGVLAGYETFRTAYALSGQGDYSRLPIDRRTDALLGAGFAGLYLGSMIYGTVNVSRCRRLKAGPALGEPVVGVTR